MKIDADELMVALEERLKGVEGRYKDNSSGYLRGKWYGIHESMEVVKLMARRHYIKLGDMLIDMRAGEVNE